MFPSSACFGVWPHLPWCVGIMGPIPIMYLTVTLQGDPLSRPFLQKPNLNDSSDGKQHF